MSTIKALLFTFAVVITILICIASAYVVYLLVLGTAIVLFFLLIRKIFMLRR